MKVFFFKGTIIESYWNKNFLEIRFAADWSWFNDVAIRRSTTDYFIVQRKSSLSDVLGAEIRRMTNNRNWGIVLECCIVVKVTVSNVESESTSDL